MDAIICESTANENGMKYVAVSDYSGLCISGTAKFRGNLYSVPYEMEVCGLEALENETTIKSVSDFPYKHPKDKSLFPRVERHYSFPFMAHRMFDDGEERVWKLNKIVVENEA